MQLRLLIGWQLPGGSRSISTACSRKYTNVLSEVGSCGFIDWLTNPACVRGDTLGANMVVVRVGVSVSRDLATKPQTLLYGSIRTQHIQATVRLSLSHSYTYVFSCPPDSVPRGRSRVFSICTAPSAEHGNKNKVYTDSSQLRESVHGSRRVRVRPQA